MAPNDKPRHSLEREPDELLDREDDDTELNEDEEAERREDARREAEDRDRRLGQAAGDSDAAPGDEDDGDGTEDVERKARQLGWRPEKEWRGKSGGWVDAATFLERSYRNRKMNKENLDRLDEELQALKSSNEELRRQNEEFARRQEDSGKVLRAINERFVRADQAAYARARADLEREREERIEEGDVKGVREVEAKLGKLVPPPSADDGDAEGEEEDTPTKPPAKGKLTPDDQAVVDAWRKKNSWFERDPFLNNQAQGIHVQLRKEQPELSLAENLDEVADLIREKYPERFENDARRAPDMPRGRERRGAGHEERVKKGRSYEDLPREAREACDRFCREIPGYTRKDYLATYEWED